MISMKEEKPIGVLLVEDDEDDYVIMKDLLSKIEGQTFQLDWVSTYQEAVNKVALNQYDICLIDYLLGEWNGIKLTRNLRHYGCQAPIILLTGQGSYDVDLQAMKEGVADYLEKSELSPMLLERAIRYALNHSKTLAALRTSKQELRVLSAKLLEAQENERRVIAQELHDSIGARMSAIRYGLEEKLHRMRYGNGSQEGISLEQVIDIVQDAAEEIHRISSNLHPSVLDDIGLLSAIRSICREVQAVREGIRIQTRLEIREEEVEKSLGIVIYRILQEALNNALKHSGADTVDVRLTGLDGFLELCIRDNGQGFDTKDHPAQGNQGKRIGLISMKERAELSNGTFEIQSKEGAGTTILVRWAY